MTDYIELKRLCQAAGKHPLGQTRSAYRHSIGELFAPFTRVAARNPYATAPKAYSAADLAAVTERNRLVADPYTRLVVSRDQVNQAAALLLTSVEHARFRLAFPAAALGSAAATERYVPGPQGAPDVRVLVYLPKGAPRPLPALLLLVRSRVAQARVHATPLRSGCTPPVSPGCD